MVEDSAIKKAWTLPVDGRRQCNQEGTGDAGGWWKKCNKEGVEAAGR